MRVQLRYLILLLGYLLLTEAAVHHLQRDGSGGIMAKRVVKKGLVDDLLAALQAAKQAKKEKGKKNKTVTATKTVTVSAPAAVRNTTAMTVTVTNQAAPASVAPALTTQMSFLTSTVYATVTPLPSTVTQTVSPGQAQGAASNSTVPAVSSTPASSSLSSSSLSSSTSSSTTAPPAVSSAPPAAGTTPTAPLESTLTLGPIGATAPAAAGGTPANADGAFGGIPGAVPLAGQSTAPSGAPQTTPAPQVVNGAGAPSIPIINLSGLSLNSVLNLGNLVQQTISAS